MKWKYFLLLLILVQACAAKSSPAQVRVLPRDSVAVLPEGKGTLKQDFITIRFSVGALEIRFTPLEEPLLRLLAPDAYQALTALVNNQRSRIDSLGKLRGVSHPGVAMVAFYSTAPNTRFDPSQLALVLQSRRLQPIGMIPLSPGFSNQQLNAREQTTGLVLFERTIPAVESFGVSYLSTLNRDWEAMLPRIDAERARILGTVARDTTRIKP